MARYMKALVFIFIIIMSFFSIRLKNSSSNNFYFQQQGHGREQDDLAPMGNLGNNPMIDTLSTDLYLGSNQNISEGLAYFEGYNSYGKEILKIVHKNNEIYVDPLLTNTTYLRMEGYLIDGRVPVIFILKNREDMGSFINYLEELGVEKIKTNKYLPLIYADIPLELLKFTNIYQYQNDILISINLDQKIEIRLSESVEIIRNSTQWNIVESKLGKKINGSGIIVAVLDTGVDKNHPDLDDIDDDSKTNDSKIILEKSFVDFDDDGIPDESPMDGYGHGTHVASIIAGTGYASNYTYVGVAPGALLMNGKVLCNDGWGKTSWIIDGITWAVDNGADVINLSLGGSGERNDPMALAVNWAVDQGVVVVVAAGNDALYGAISSPGVADKAITVGAINKDLSLADYSSKGPVEKAIIKPDVVAPGSDIVAARANGTSMGYSINEYYTSASGTSMATPHIAGAVALILQAHPDWSPDIVKAALMNTAVNLGYHPFEQGAGLINVTAAVLSDIVVFPSSYSYLNNTRDMNQLSILVEIRNIGDSAKDLTISVNLTRYDSYENKIGRDDLTEVVSIEHESVSIGANGTVNVSIVIDLARCSDGYYNGTIYIEDEDSNRVYKVVFFFYRNVKIILKVFDDYGELMNPNRSDIVMGDIVIGLCDANYSLKDIKFYNLEEIFYFKRMEKLELELLRGRNYTIFTAGVVVLSNSMYFSDYAFYFEKNISVKTDMTLNFYLKDLNKIIIELPNYLKEALSVKLFFGVLYRKNNELENLFSMEYIGYSYFIGDRVIYLANVSKYFCLRAMISTDLWVFSNVYYLGYILGPYLPKENVIRPTKTIHYKILHDVPYNSNKFADPRKKFYSYWLFWAPKEILGINFLIPTLPSFERHFYFWINNDSFRLMYKYYLDTYITGEIFVSAQANQTWEILSHYPKENLTFILGHAPLLPGKIYVENDNLYVDPFYKMGTDSIIVVTDKLLTYNISVYRGDELIPSYKYLVSNNVFKAYLYYLNNDIYHFYVRYERKQELWNRTLLYLAFNKTSENLTLPTIESINMPNFYEPGSNVSFSIKLDMDALDIKVYWLSNDTWQQAMIDIVEANKSFLVHINNILEIEYISVMFNISFGKIANLTYIIERAMMRSKTIFINFNVANAVSNRDTLYASANVETIDNDTRVPLFASICLDIVNLSDTVCNMTDYHGETKLAYYFKSNITGWVLSRFRVPAWFIYKETTEEIMIYVGLGPDICVLQPKEYSYVHGMLRVTGTAKRREADIVGIWGRLYPYTQWKKATGIENWFLDLDTTNAPDGACELQIKINDTIGINRMVKMVVIVDNTAPEIQMFAASFVLNTTTFSIEVQASDNMGLKEVKLFLNNTLYVTSNESHFVYTFENICEARYILRAIAFDIANNTAISERTIIIDTSPPEIEFISPKNGSKITSTKIKVKWSVKDDMSGVLDVKIRLDNETWILLSSIDTEYVFENVSEGKHTLSIMVSDYAGNIALKTISFTVVKTLMIELLIGFIIFLVGLAGFIIYFYKEYRRKPPDCIWGMNRGLGREGWGLGGGNAKFKKRN